MATKKSHEWDDSSSKIDMDAALFGAGEEWDDGTLDPNWKLEDELPEDAKAFTEFDTFVDALDEHMGEDPGFAGSPESIEFLARMYIEHKPSYLRAESTLRPYKVLSMVRPLVRAHARKLSNLSPVPGGGRPKYASVKSLWPSAPIHEGAVVPPSWEIGKEEDEGHDYKLIKRVLKRAEGGFVEDHIGVSYVPLFVNKLLVNIKNNDTFVNIAWPTKRGWRSKSISRDKIKQQRELISSMAMVHGFPAHANNAKDIITYLDDYESHNEIFIQTVDMSHQMGWQGKTQSRFLIGKNTVKSHDSSEMDIQFLGLDEGEEQVVRSVKPEGSIENWRSSIKIVSNFPFVEIALYASLSPPLLQILEAPNFCVDWCHKTSAGKTTTLSVAASCWGNPNPNASDSYLASWDMTPVGFERRAAVLNCLPLIVDDTKRARKYGKESIIPSVVYEVTNGQGRIRGSTKGTAKTAYWQTVMLSSGEQRVIDFDKSGGTPARVITLWGNPFGGTNNIIAEAIRNLKTGIYNNYGHAGPALVQWLTNNKDRWSEIQKDHKERWAIFKERLIDTAEDISMDIAVMDRMACNLAVLDVTAEIAHNALDLPWELDDPLGIAIPIIAPAASSVDREKEAMVMAISWAMQNRKKFCTSEKNRQDDEPHGGWAGYWEAAIDDSWRDIFWFPVALRKLLDDWGFEPNSIFRQWKEADWLTTTDDRITGRCSFLRGRPRMICVSREAIMKFDEIEYDEHQQEMPF
jgi:hypothetical protein